jgi:hypothetical protein
MPRRRPQLPAAPEGTASLYVRLSKRADDENLSKDGMLADVRHKAAEMGLHVVGEHIDDGKTGALRNRPFAIGAEVAREQRERMSDLQKSAKARIRSVPGRIRRAGTPFGWRTVRREFGAADPTTGRRPAGAFREIGMPSPV